MGTLLQGPLLPAQQSLQTPPLPPLIPGLLTSLQSLKDSVNCHAKKVAKKLTAWIISNQNLLHRLWQSLNDNYHMGFCHSADSNLHCANRAHDMQMSAVNTALVHCVCLQI